MALDVKVTGFRQCQPCLSENIQRGYAGYCVECPDYLCENCIKEHKRNKASKGHAILPFKEGGSTDEIISCLEGLLTCKEHPTFELNRFCEDHKQNVCSVCLSTNHQNCTGSVKQNVGINQTKIMSHDIQSEITSLKEKTLRNKEQLKEQSELVAFKRKKVVDELYQHINYLDKNLQNEITLLFNSEQEILRNDLEEGDELERQRYILTQLLLWIEDKEMPNKHVIVHAIETKFDTIKRKVSTHLNKRDARIVFVETNTELMSLGTVKKEIEYETEMSSTCADCMDNEEEAKAEGQSFQAEPLPVVHEDKKVEKVGVPLFRRKCALHCRYSLPRDQADVSGIVVLENSWLVVADQKNQTIYVFDETGKFLYETYCRCPRSLCETGEGTVIAVLSTENTIQRRHVLQHCMVDAGSFVCKLDCKAISRCNDGIGLLVKCRDDTYMVQIRHARGGKVVRTIRLDEDVCDSSHAHRCLLHLQDGTFAVDDGDNLQCFDDDGDDVWFYKQYSRHNRVAGISGFAEDGEGNVYMCCQNSKNIHQVSRANYRMNRVILMDLDSPRSIAFDKSKQELYIAGRRTGEIGVYKFT